MGGLDSYTIRARLIPAFIGIAPALALATIAVSWQEFSLPQAITTVATGVLFFVFADLARRFGRHAEKKIFSSTCGKPFPTVLRHRDQVMNADEKARYLGFLADKLSEEPPSREAEQRDPKNADKFYVRCGNWLRERTRDHTVYKLIFEENVTYGFRRNLYGIKIFGMTLNLLCVLVCLYILYATQGSALWHAAAILIFAGLHGTYLIFAVTKKSVLEASDQYGRQLVLACESLMDK